MKKIVYGLLALMVFASCKYHPCCVWEDEYYGHPVYERSVSDYLPASNLIGTWQVENNNAYYEGIGIMPKQIVFFDSNWCDITYEVSNRSTERLTETFRYSYNGRYIRFSSTEGTLNFGFKIEDFLYPTLTLRDSYGRYKWCKRS